MSQQSLCKGEKNVSISARQKIENVLAQDEQLVWIGQPLAFVIVMEYIHYFLVGAAVLGAGIYFYMGEVVMPVPIVFILIGIGAMCIPVLHFVAAKGTVYALTTKRAIVILQKIVGQEHRFYKPSDLVFMQVEDLPNRYGAGHLVFQSEKTVNSSQDQAGNISESESTKNYGFLAIDGVGEIEKLVRKTLLNKKSS